MEEIRLIQIKDLGIIPFEFTFECPTCKQHFVYHGNSHGRNKKDMKNCRIMLEGMFINSHYLDCSSKLSQENKR